LLAIAAILPTLNARATLERTLASIHGRVSQIVVSDGGSTDGTQILARELGASLVEGPPGRGGQLRRGAQAAQAQWFLFLHADTLLGAAWENAARAMMADHPDRAGYFRFALDDPAPVARAWERRVAWRARTFGLPYGDQGLLIARTHYLALGGYKDIPLMEDVDMVRRIGRRKLVSIDAAALTSAAKFQRDGYMRRSVRNIACLALYFAGVRPETIRRIYR
jgi:rSAM/selenodomain-associated transferase 2